jgi:hypothetical protein
MSKEATAATAATAAIRRVWWGRVAYAVVTALVINFALWRLEVDHDPALISLLAAATVAVGAMAVEAFVAGAHIPWTSSHDSSRVDTGEDTRTLMYRRVVEAHFTAHDADDAVVWQLADLAARRLRQVHGLRYADDPERATRLLGPLLADWVSHDRRHRYRPDHRHTRYTRDQLNEVLSRIEAL